MALPLPRLLSLLALLLVGLTAVHAHGGLTNGERLARGMPLAKPRRLFEPTRVQHAKRSGAPTSQTAPIGITLLTAPPRARSPTDADSDLPSRELGLSLGARQSLPVFSFYIAPETGNPSNAPGVTTTTSPGGAVQLTYTVASPGVQTSFSNGGLYISTCCQPSHCYIDANDGAYVTLAWTYTSSPAGAYPGETGPNGPASEESCSNLESVIYTVDEASGAISIQYLNAVNPALYPSGTTVPPQQVPTYVVLFNGFFYLTGNPAATIALLSGGQQVALYVAPQ